MIRGVHSPALLFFSCCWASMAVAQLPASAAKSDQPHGISYSQSQLTIDVANVTLAELLLRISAVTSVKIDTPVEANSVRLPVVKRGPGPARDVIASLLREMHFNYIVQASETDPLTIQSILIVPADIRENSELSTDTARMARLGRFRTEGEAAAAQDSASPAASGAIQNPNESSPQSVTSSPGTNNAAPLPAAPESASAIAQPMSSGALRPGALATPPVLNPSAISQQLQQMYAQRVQMIQQGKPAGTQP